MTVEGGRKPTRLPCKTPGCERTVRNVTGYCAEHVNKVTKCRIDGCGNLVAFHNKTGCCRDHRPEGKRLGPQDVRKP